VKLKALTVIALSTALVATGCSGRSPSSEPSSSPSVVAAPGDFGDVKGVCGSGSQTSSPAKGVTASQIQVGVFSDVGFTKNPEFVDAAKVFTSWCNDAGGINGRKLVASTRDTQLLAVDQQMLAACDQDFALVGGGAAFDGLGVADRLKCLLPDFPAQVVQSTNVGSDLQLNQTSGTSYFRYAGYFHWLLKEAYPGSASKVGMIVGDSPITKDVGAQTREGLINAGATMAYDDLYPIAGVSDWTPYAQTIKAKGVKGLVFNGDFNQLAKLEQTLTSIGYKLDWIDTNNNAYGIAFLTVAAASLGFQNNVADLGGIWPIEKASANPATLQAERLYAKYAPKATLTLPALRALSSWLLFAKAATSCGAELTRSCLYAAARKESAWTGGGLQAPVDLSSPDTALKCFNVEKAVPGGWEPADFKPTQGAYRCDAPVYKYTGTYAKPVTLASVGKSLSDLK
jgi:ABC-type branched-subunit amino acid transport system substrate-binding protein